MMQLFLFSLSIYFFLISAPVFSEEVVNLGPLLNMREDGSREVKEVEGLGPFITYQREKQRKEFGLHPFFYLLMDKEKDLSEFEFLYPIVTYKRNEESKKFQMFLYLLSYESGLKEGKFREKDFTLFPLIFARKSEDSGRSFFAFFPIYGDMRDKFSKDEIEFFLFPLFLRTTNDKFVNYSFLWPFFGYYTGEGQEGFRFWPFFGYRKRGQILKEDFILWPLYVSKHWVYYGKETDYLSFFPFYSTFRSSEREQNTYLWPFFSYLRDRDKNIERWDVPWPILNITRGSKSENRFFPFYANEKGKTYEEGFFLWPLYRYETLTLEDFMRTRRDFLLFLYSDIEEKPILEGGREGRRISLWPIFTYRRDREGNKNFFMFSLFEPFLSNKRLDRNYSSLWRIYQWQRSKDGNWFMSFFWNTIRFQNEEDQIEIKVHPIVPLFSLESSEKGSKIYLLGGFLGYRSSEHEKTIKLFYIPVSFSRKTEEVKEGFEQ